MKKQIVITGTLVIAAGLMPSLSQAQGLASDINGLQGTLDTVYEDMLPMFGQLIGVGRAIAGFGALWYIAARVWRQIANAEAIDFYPLLRPFALGLAIMMFPVVITVINGIMKPTVSATAGMVKDSDAAIARLLKAKEDAVKQTSTWQMYEGDDGQGNRDKWYKYTHPDDKSGDKEGVFEGVGNDVKFAMAKASYKFRNTVKKWMSEVLQVAYEAASLCINTIRTFYLIVLAILGPIVFGAIIGKVQENMLKIDIGQVQQSGDTFFSSTDTAYLIFLIIGTIGYFTLPSVAGYIVNAGGMNGLLSKVNTLVSSSTNTVVAGGSAVGSRAMNGAKNLFNAPGQFMEGYYGKSSASGQATDDYQKKKLTGN